MEIRKLHALSFMAFTENDTPDICPVCDTLVPDGAIACPHCGADAETGWSDRARAQNLGIPDDEPFDADAFAEEEFGHGRQRRLPWIWILTGAVLLLIVAYGLLSQFLR
jgi:hypothetical protein